MAIQFIDGFDLYNGVVANIGLASQWAVSGPSTMPAGRFGGQCMRFATTTNVMVAERTLPATVTSCTAGMAVQTSASLVGVPLSKAHIALRTAGTWQCGIQFSLNGVINAYRLSSATAGTLLQASATGVWSPNVWQYVEVEFVISTTVGRITVYVNGTQVLNVTGVNTANAGAGTSANSLILGSSDNTNALGNYDVDDLYFTDTAAKLGERRVETLRPSADTAQKDWTPDTGTANFSRVNATLAQQTTYVQASTVGNLDLYDIADLSSTPTTIDAVNLVAFAQKTDATTRAIQLAAKLSATTVTSSDNPLNVGVAKFNSLLSAKPGGGAWAAADVNALQIGPKVSV